MFDRSEYFDNLAKHVDTDINRVIHDHFRRQLEEHFAKTGALVIDAREAGGDVFAGAKHTDTMGDFVFESIEVNGDCVGLDIIRGHVTGNLAKAFEHIDGLDFELWIKTQGYVRHRVINAQRQVRAVWAEHSLHELDDLELLDFQDRWEVAKAK